MIILAVFVLSLIIFIIVLFLLAKNRYKEDIANSEVKFQFLFMAPASLYLIDKLHTIDFFSKIILHIHFKIIKIYGNKNGIFLTKLFIAQIISVDLLLLLLFSLMGLLNDDLVLFYFGLFLSIISPLIIIKGLDREIQKKHEQIIIELPEFLNKIILLVNAGETVQQAIIRSVLTKNDGENSYLYKELLLSVKQMQNNLPFNHVLEELSKRCGTQEIAVFTTTLLLNYRRGSSDLVISLTRLSQELWDKRIALSRITGEQASSKLVFPMVLIFIVVLVIVGTPTIILF